MSRYSRAELEVEFQSGQHICWLYETQEEYDTVIASFIRQGIRNNVRIIYIRDTSLESRFRFDFSAFRPSLEPGQVVELTAQEIYFPEQIFDPIRVIACIEALITQAIEDGYAGLYITGEMTWVLQSFPGSERLIEYESLVNETIRSRPVLRLCQYRTCYFPPARLMDFLVTHPLVLLGTQSYENIYYTPPGEFLGPNRDQALLENRIHNIRSMATKKAQLNDSNRLLEQSIDAIVITDENGRVSEWNRSAEQVFGIERETARGQYIWDLQSQASVNTRRREQIRTQQKELTLRILRGEEGSLENRFFQVKILRPDGQIRRVRSVIYTVKTAKGIIACSLTRDVTEETSAQAAIASSEKRYRLLSELTSDCAYCLRVAANGNLTTEWVTKTFPQLLGWTSDEFYRMGSFQKIVYPEDVAVYRAHKEKWLAGQISTSEFRILAQTGEVRWIRDRKRPVWSKKARRVTLVYGALSDITDRKTAELAIRDSEQKFHDLFDTMANGVIFRDAGGNVLSANLAAMHILGRSLSHLQTNDNFDRQHPLIQEDGSPIPQEGYPAMVALKTGQEVRGKVLGAYNPVENRYRWILMNATPQFNSGDQIPYQVFTTFEDITEIKEANLALQASEVRFRTLIEKAPLAIGINRKGLTLYANSRHLQLFGYKDLEEIKGKPVTDQIAPCFAKRSNNARSSVQETAQSVKTWNWSGCAKTAHNSPSSQQ